LAGGSVAKTAVSRDEQRAWIRAARTVELRAGERAA